MNISKEDYLKAKELIKLYEKENKKHIGIICLNKFDFDEYKESIELNDLHIFHKISKITDLCSLCLDNYVVTQLGDQNSEFEQIMELLRYNLKVKI